MLLRLENLQRRRGGTEVLGGVELSWEGPGVLAVTGPNGAGKSTLLSVIAGVLEADEGCVSIADRALDAGRSALREVGYVPDHLDLPPQLRGTEFVALTAALKGVAPPDEALTETLGVQGYVHTPLGAMSLGQRRRVSLLAALCGDPRLLVLDEPTNGLDAAGLDTLARLLRGRVTAGRGAVLATHDRGFAARVADATLELPAGVLRSTGPAVEG